LILVFLLKEGHVHSKSNLMSKRSVEAIIAPRAPHFVGDGFRVHNFIPGAYHLDMQRMDPFIMLDYGSPFYFPPSEKPRGVDVHPHRGFETVTIAYKGRVAHLDSSGGGGVIGEGDVQWMTAGSGILHKEFHEASFSKEGGMFQMAQLWVNLPAKDKMTAPGYQAIAKDEVAVLILPDDAGQVEVIAGECRGVKGPATTFSPVHLYNLRLKKGAVIDLELPQNFNSGLLVVEGNITLDQERVDTHHFALLKNDGDIIQIKAPEDALVLVLSGQPLREPIVSHGPFVMNTREQIAQAIKDFHEGKFGYLD
jgi:quercetin 2,3-dioxygenase